MPQGRFPHLVWLIASVCTLGVLAPVWLLVWLLWMLATPAAQREPAPVWLWLLIGTPVALGLLMLVLA